MTNRSIRQIQAVALSVSILLAFTASASAQGYQGRVPTPTGQTSLAPLAVGELTVQDFQEMEQLLLEMDWSSPGASLASLESLMQRAASGSASEKPVKALVAILTLSPEAPFVYQKMNEVSGQEKASLFAKTVEPIYKKIQEGWEALPTQNADVQKVVGGLEQKLQAVHKEALEKLAAASYKNPGAVPDTNLTISEVRAGAPFGEYTESLSGVRRFFGRPVMMSQQRGTAGTVESEFQQGQTEEELGGVSHEAPGQSLWKSKGADLSTKVSILTLASVLHAMRFYSARFGLNAASGSEDTFRDAPNQNAIDVVKAHTQLKKLKRRLSALQQDQLNMQLDPDGFRGKELGRFVGMEEVILTASIDEIQREIQQIKATLPTFKGPLVEEWARISNEVLLLVGMGVLAFLVALTLTSPTSLAQILSGIGILSVFTFVLGKWNMRVAFFYALAMSLLIAVPFLELPAFASYILLGIIVSYILLLFFRRP